MAESEIPTVDEIAELTEGTFGGVEALLAAERAVASIPLEPVRPHERTQSAGIPMEWGAAARELGYPVEPMDIVVRRASKMRSAKARRSFLAEFGFKHQTVEECEASLAAKRAVAAEIDAQMEALYRELIDGEEGHTE